MTLLSQCVPHTGGLFTTFMSSAPRLKDTAIGSEEGNKTKVDLPFSEDGVVRLCEYEVSPKRKLPSWAEQGI